MRLKLQWREIDMSGWMDLEQGKELWKEYEENFKQEKKELGIAREIIVV